jgi:hypothetical protein
MSESMSENVPDRAAPSLCLKGGFSLTYVKLTLLVPRNI